MSPEPVPLSLVVPVYNSARFIEPNLRRAWSWLCANEPGSELIVVDDCSADATPSIVRRLQEELGSERVRLLRNDVNSGKGYSVRRAMRESRGEVAVFTDADLTYPIENVGNVVQSLRGGADVAIACRVHADSRYIVNATFLPVLLTRHLIGRCFNTIVRTTMVGRVRDTQAGLKGFSRRAVATIFPLQTLERFSFDVEVLFIARKHGLAIDAVGVEFIYRKEPSTIRFVADSLRMLGDMMRIRWNSLTGRYELRPEASATDDGRDE